MASVLSEEKVGSSLNVSEALSLVFAGLLVSVRIKGADSLADGTESGGRSIHRASECSAYMLIRLASIH
jgi:hypothetical protein